MKVVVLFLLSFSLLAAKNMKPDNSSNCGIGWTVADKISILASSVRSMTNMTASNTIGMTFGTSGCKKHSIVLNSKKGLYYSVSNFESLKTEMALGEGEFLTAFAHTLGCKPSSFAGLMQNNYGQIVQANQTPQQLLQNVQTVIGPQSSNCQ